MGKVAVTLQVMPDSPETDMEKIKNEIQEKINPQEMKDEPIAFGLKALIILIIKEDSEGGTEQLEEEIRQINGVREARVKDVTLI